MTPEQEEQVSGAEGKRKDGTTMKGAGGRQEENVLCTPPPFLVLKSFSSVAANVVEHTEEISKHAGA